MQATRIAIWILMCSSFAIAAGQTAGHQPVSRPNPEPGSGEGRGVQGERLRGRADVSSGVGPYLRLIPVPPQGLTAAPYPHETRIIENRIDIPGGAARRVWLEARMGGWRWVPAYLCDGGAEHNERCDTHSDCPGGFCGQPGLLNWWEVVVDPASFANGYGADLRMPEIPCSQTNCTNELGLDHSGVCQWGDFCDAALIQARPDRVPMDLEFAGFLDSLGLYCAGTQVATPVVTDEGLDYYGGTYVLDIPQEARGLYVVDFVTGDQTLFQVQDDSVYYHDDTTPAIINVCHPGECGERRNRFLSILPPLGLGGEPGEFAIRVGLLVLPQFQNFDNAIRWVSAPAEYVDDPVASSTFTASRLGCQPYFQDWSSIGALDIFGPEVVPGSLYEIRYGDFSCVLSGDDSCLSEPVYITTASWGDVVNGGGVGQTNFEDIATVVEKFSGLSGAVSAVRAKLYGNVLDPSTSVNFQDISAAVTAFRGLPYPYAGPSACP